MYIISLALCNNPITGAGTFFDKSEMCDNIPLLMKHCCTTEMPQPENHIYITNQNSLVQNCYDSQRILFFHTCFQCVDFVLEVVFQHHEKSKHK